MYFGVGSSGDDCIQKETVDENSNYKIFDKTVRMCYLIKARVA